MQVGCVSTPVGPDPSSDAEERKIEKVSPRPNVTSQTISKLREPKKPGAPTIRSLLGRGAENIQKLFLECLQKSKTSLILVTHDSSLADICTDQYKIINQQLKNEKILQKMKNKWSKWLI